MPQNYKSTLDFFSVDTFDDDKIEMLKAEHGLIGYAIIIEIWKRAYRENGFYYTWTHRQEVLFCRRENIDQELCRAVVETALAEDILDRALFNTYQILTSRGMQKRYFRVCYERRSPEIITEYLLMEAPELRPGCEYTVIPICFPDGARESKPKSEGVPRKATVNHRKLAGTSGESKGLSEDVPTEALHSKVKDNIETREILSADADWRLDLYNIIKDSFESIYGEFENYGKEGKAIKGIIAKVEKRVEHDQGFAEPEAVGAFIRGLCEAFLFLTKKGDDFWTGQPFLPSTLNSSGIYSRVITNMDREAARIKLEQRFAGAFEGFQFNHATG
jgi:hypothetical protein|tara:strand:- start:1222 stop:2217 length:996 start_codon:yes stop_codon:yes gene_type:complete